MKKRKGKQTAVDRAPEPSAGPGDDETTSTTATTTIAIGVVDIEISGEGAIDDDRGDARDFFGDVVTSVDRVVDADAVTGVDRVMEAETAAPESTAVDAASEPSAGGATAGAPATEVTDPDSGALPEVEGSRLESIIESLLFAADRPLMLNDFKRLLADRDAKRITGALENLQQRHADSGIQLVSVAGGWQLRTHPGNGVWVARLVAARPPRLSRAMMETLSIVAYRQPITRPEIDDIRGVDCGPVLHTLLDRGLIRVIGKKEEVGRPILYGTTPEFLKVFSLRDLTDLPTLRDFHELADDDRAEVEARTGAATGTAADDKTTAGVAAPGIAAGLRPDDLLEIDHEEEDSLLQELDRASESAGLAARPLDEPEPGGGETTATTRTETEASPALASPESTSEDTARDAELAAISEPDPR